MVGSRLKDKQPAMTTRHHRLNGILVLLGEAPGIKNAPVGVRLREECFAVLFL